MTDDGTPACTSCGHILDRIDHVGIEHFILDNDVFREVNCAEGLGGEVGLASDIDVRCGYCGASLPRELRAFFYQRWCRVLDLIGKE